MLFRSVAVAGAVALEAVDDALVDETEELGRLPSGGKGSPGLSMYAESFASRRWFSREVFAFGLITPTIPYVIQDPTAEQ